MSNYFDDLARKRGLTRDVTPEPTTPTDLAGAIANAIRDEVARAVAGIPRQPGQKPLTARAEATLRRMEKAVRGVPRPAPSVVDPPAPTIPKKPLPPGEFTFNVLDRDHRGAIWHGRFDGPDGRAFIFTVGQRDQNGRIERGSFTPVA